MKCYQKASYDLNANFLACQSDKTLKNDPRSRGERGPGSISLLHS